jgi:glycosyltransferase involved in cell wall biosynthesis
MSSLSVCMMVQNAEKTLAIALESLSYVYDELIIVDGGSTDLTCDIALSYGAKIIHSPWPDNYAQQRNVYLAHVKTDWFFTIDADEFIDIKTLEFLSFFKQNPTWATTDSYMILRKWISPFSNKYYIINEPYLNDKQSKLLKCNPHLQYQGLIHEGFSGLENEPVEISGISIYHLDLLLHSEEERREKVARYEQTSLKCGHSSEFILQAHSLYLPSLTNLQLAELHDEELLPSVRRMLAQLTPKNINFDKLNLREINYIIFPDWLQDEETIGLELQKLIKALITHPDSEKITLLIYIGNVDSESVEMFISGIAMNLLMEEDIDISQGLQISLVGELSHREWESLLPFIAGRTVLKQEDKEVIRGFLLEDIKVLELDRLVN